MIIRKGSFAGTGCGATGSGMLGQNSTSSHVINTLGGLPAVRMSCSVCMHTAHLLLSFLARASTAVIGQHCFNYYLSGIDVRKPESLMLPTYCCAAARNSAMRGTSLLEPARLDFECGVLYAIGVLCFRTGQQGASFEALNIR